MTEIEWEGVPAALRERVDELVLADEWFRAVTELWRHGGDIRLFNGAVPPWPEAQEAAELGTGLAKRFSVPFYFESPDTPDLPRSAGGTPSDGVPGPRAGGG